MRLREILKKYVIPALGSYMTVDNFVRYYFPSEKDVRTYEYLVEELKTAEGARKLEVIDAIQKIERKYANLYNFLEARQLRLAELHASKDNNFRDISSLKDKIINNRYNPGESRDWIEKLVQLREAEIKRIDNQIALEDYAVKQRIEESDQQGVFDWFNSIVDQFRLFLDTLTQDQLAILFNLFGYFMIFQSIFSISLILLGELLIQKLELEKRYPRVSNFIRIRAKLKKVSLWIHVTLLFVILFILVGVNILMFFYSYSSGL